MKGKVYEKPNKIEEIEMQYKKHQRNGSLAVEPIDETHWKLIITTGVISMLTAMENTAINIGEWPYMKTVDTEATAQFFGMATSVSKVGHAVFAMIFAVWSFRFKTVRAPLLIGRILATLACCLYLCVEYFPTNKRYIMMTCYSFLSIANSATTVLRAYVAAVSTVKDRPRAFAAIGISFVASIIVGPLLQLSFSGIHYPGYLVLPGIYFNVYTAPIWFALICSSSCIFVIFFFMEEIPQKGKASDDYGIQSIREAVRKLLRSNINWKLVAVCLICKTGATFTQTMMGAITSIMYMTVFGMTGAETVFYGSIFMGGFGVIAVVVLLSYMFLRFGERVPQHIAFLIATLIIGSGYIITYPYPFDSNPVPAYNETLGSGCSSDEYSWCETALAPNFWIFLPVLLSVVGFGTPVMINSLDTIYSNILGPIDQNVMQAIVVILDDGIGMITPIFATTMFTAFGIGPLWLVKIFIFYLIAGIWLVNIKSLKAYVK